MKKFFLVGFVGLCSLTISAQQKFFTKTGSISFYSNAPLEKIEAHNKQVACILNTQTQELGFKVLIKSFEFKQALMQEHFNENYMESDKFPNANFEGKITSSGVNYTKDGSYPVEVAGKLTIHGVTKDVKSKGTLVVKSGGSNLELSSTFAVLLKDYNIKNDKLESISENVEIVVKASLTELKK